MSNTLLQNTGTETFLNLEDYDPVGLEDNFFEDVSSFAYHPLADTMGSEVDEDDLPLTNYLLKFNGGDEDPWESGEELSVGGESGGDDEIYELGWAVDPGNLEAGIFDDVDLSDEQESPSDKMELRKEKSTPVKKTGKTAKKATEKNVVVDCKKQTKRSVVNNRVKVAESVQCEVQSSKATADAKVVLKHSANELKEPQKSRTTTKSQAEKAKEQRERKKKYIQELQDTIAELKKDKASMEQVTTQLSDKIVSLREEISYLKGVITNQSELARILRSVADTPGIAISCSVLQDKEGNSGKRKYDPAGKEGSNVCQESAKRRKVDKSATGEMDNNAGVCVHVQSGKVSLEFCAECSKKANRIVT